jgi:hypothetical protein
MFLSLCSLVVWSIWREQSGVVQDGDFLGERECKGMNSVMDDRGEYS